MKRLADSGMWPWLAVTASFAGAFVIVCLLSASAPPDSDDAGGITDMLFGSSRRALSASMYEEADAFFHRGVPHRQRRAEMNDWIQRLRADISPEAHRHADGLDSAEIIPWLKMATGADPHNVDAWLVSAFWLETGMQRPDLAEQVLREAQRHNPADYRVLLERGRCYIRGGRFDAAGSVLDAALVRWPGSQDPQDLQSLLDKAEMLSYRALLMEMAGSTNQAVMAFKNVLALFPERTYIGERMRMLESGQPPADSAQTLLQRQVKRSTRTTCEEETENDHKEHENGGDHG